jgi:hypothetical protein
MTQLIHIQPRRRFISHQRVVKIQPITHHCYPFI